MKINTPFRLVFFAVLFCLPAIIFAQATVYSKVKVDVAVSGTVQRLADLNFDIDHYEGDADRGISFFVTAEELNRLASQGFNYEIIIPDFNEYYEEQQLLDIEKMEFIRRTQFTANGFDFGSMGGFYTYDEVESKLDEMKSDYPNLITAKSSIGTTIDGNTIWMAKISDNPDINEMEPAVYFDGLHHAREPLSMATNINFMFWLLEHYATDTSVQYLIDNREIYFVPIVNPDGYKFNELTNPNGGGLWRKNRNVDAGGCIGVDLNRNYGFEFAHDGSCASGDPCSNTYHGEGPFSELETIAVRDFISQVEPNTAFSMHSTAGTYLMPYGYDTSPPAYEIYSEWASSFLDECEYTYGVTYQMLGYTSCGTTRDYLHSEGIYGWTPEIGGSGFWPQQSEILDLVGENVRPMLYQSWIAGAYLDIQHHEQIGAALPGENFQLVVELKNVGVGATAVNSSVILQASDPDIMVPTATGFGNIPARTRQDNSGSPFIISIDPSFSGSSFNLTINSIQDGVLNETAEITIYIGDKNVLFFDDAENGDFHWLASGNGIPWGIVLDDAYSDSACFGDSNGGNGLNNTLNYFELDEIVDLSSTTLPLVTFMSKYSIESFDNVQFQISTDSGSSWQALETFSLNDRWNQHTYDLSAYTAFSDVRFRFRLQNDGGIPGDGFYFDDFEITDYDNGILNIDEATILSEVKIFPNPFLDLINVNGIAAQDAKIQIYDTNGRELEVSVVGSDDKNLIVDLSAIVSGLYFLKLSAVGESSIVKRIIKQ